MSCKNSLLTQQEWRIIDHSSEGSLFEAKKSFAIDDTLCASVGSGKSSPILRSWVHHNTVVLGIQDTRLPFLAEGISYLQKQGFHSIVRNSGGLAVVLDEDVLNLSLIFPDTEKGIDIDRGYDTMVDLIRLILADYSISIEAKEIAGSYCPGSYDLSIKNKKFAGISQRRLRGGVAVQIYLCVRQSGSKRAELIKNFYKTSIKNQETKTTFPTIFPSTMASLTELLHTDITIHELLKKTYQALMNSGASLLTHSELTLEEESLFEQNLLRMIDRNQKALGF